MLNSEIKRKIDNARDILVGKIPIPSQQIEQITIALIYKFTSDIDSETKDFGGEGFFVGEFEKYSWSNIMDRRIGGQERLNLYGEGLDKMGLNPHLPQMFRDIFRNAYLPFKDPSTLDMFLKQIDEFSYDHSENLGDAFEYLLSTAGSQGDAGQFRTPRHIIDFIVSVVQPQFSDTVLDPACGTAGFLISAYKYIMNQNKDKVAGDKLSLPQKKELTQHFVGYDISYEMVRLSLVNMYLHNFGDPKIYEYDTLSSTDRWDDRFDCILANPPFMTPKGGIQPHNRFSIKASKSEVLFVDYMIEHLNPHGKAGIVVPEGIIFQGANAYKDLRKKMIKENYLWAVVSLPAGVFQPYSGVKTSILLFDKEIAKKTDKILFVKVQNDGFDLGAQRRPSNKNDLPKATEILLKYKQDLIAGNEINLENSEMTLLVSKEKIEENSEFNLSMDRYRPTGPINTNYDIVKLGDIATISSGNSAPQDEKLFENGKYPFFRTADVGEVHISDNLCITKDKLNEEGIKGLKLFKKGTILFPKSGASTFLNHRVIMGIDGYVVSHLATIEADEEKVLPRYLYYMLIFVDAKSLCAEQGYPSLRTSEISNIEIPLPPLEVQEKIVAELDGYQKVIDGAKMIVDNYKPTIKINPEWKMVKLGDVCEIGSSKRVFESEWRTQGVPFYRAREIVKLAEEGYVDNELFIDESMYEEYTAKYGKPQKGDLLVTGVGTLGICYEVKEGDKFYFKDGNIIRFYNFNEKKVSSTYIKYLYKTEFIKNQIATFGVGGVVGTYTITHAKNTNIPLPSVEEQNQIVAEIEKEEAMVESAKQLIEVFEKKIKDRIDEIWGK